MHPEIQRREKLVLDRMKTLTEEEKFYGLYVVAQILVNREKNDNVSMIAKNSDDKINIVKD